MDQEICKAILEEFNDLIAWMRPMQMIEGCMVALGIVGVCLGVRMLWNAPLKFRLYNWMKRNFMHRPVSGKTYTLLTSVFSHQELWHLAANSMTFISFGELDVPIDDFPFAFVCSLHL